MTVAWFDRAIVSGHTRECAANQHLVLHRMVNEEVRESYSPSGIDVGIDFGILPIPRENGCMVGEQWLSLEETYDVFS